MWRQSRFIEQWIPHDGTVWKIWEVRTLLMRFLGVPSDYGVVRNSKVVYVCGSLEEAREYIRNKMVEEEVQIPFHLLPTVPRRFIAEAERKNNIYFEESDLSRAGVLDLTRYGWMELTPMGGNFRRIPAR